MKDNYIMSTNSTEKMDGYQCSSRKRKIDNKNLNDCIEQGQLKGCMGCKYYTYSQK